MGELTAQDNRVGVHGIVLVNGKHPSVFLPKVPVEQGRDRLTYLDQLSLKAGSWRSPEVNLYGFTTEVIREH
jgi:AMMECR1 domain-containing protein